jgi:hypothetical protein
VNAAKSCKNTKHEFAIDRPNIQMRYCYGGTTSVIYVTQAYQTRGSSRGCRKPETTNSTSRRTRCDQLKSNTLLHAELKNYLARTGHFVVFEENAFENLGLAVLFDVRQRFPGLLLCGKLDKQFVAARKFLFIEKDDF